MPRPASILGVTVLSLVLAPACASRARLDPQDAATGLQERTGALPRVSGATAPEIPAGMRLDDGLTPDEAVAVALWNNAAFQVSVSELGFARADLLDAGVLTNPVLSLLFPVGPNLYAVPLRYLQTGYQRRPEAISSPAESPSSG